MATMPGIIIKIGAETRDAIQGINRVDRALGKSASRARKARAVVAGTAKAVGVTALAAGAAVAAVTIEGVKAAVEDQQSQRKLQQTLKNTVKANAAVVKSYEDYISQAQQKSALDDGDLRAGNERLLRSTKDVTKAQELSTLAMDIALQTGRDFPSTAAAVAKAYDGNTGALKRLGVAIPKGKESKWLQILNDQFKGGTAAYMDTYAGAAAGVATSFDELKESFGMGFLGGTDGVPGQMDQLTQAMYDAGPAAEQFGSALATMMTTVLQQLPNFLLGLQGLKDGVHDFYDNINLGVTNVGDFLGIIPDDQADSMRRQFEGQITGRRQDLQSLYSQLYPTANPYDSYRPMAAQQRRNDTTKGADSRAAQREARTRQSQ